MKILKKLKINGLWWDVKYDDNVSREGNCYGSTHHTSQNIFLEPKLSRQKTEQTFLHEILHVVWDLQGLSQNKKFSREDEELLVDTLANGLYAALKDNKLI